MEISEDCQLIIFQCKTKISKFIKKDDKDKADNLPKYQKRVFEI